jgi:hypothetical protein
MHTYIGTKQLIAKPMTLGDYNQYRGWQLPGDENGSREGYLVLYPDGYESWAPKEVFEAAYLPCGDDPSRIDAGMVGNFIRSITFERRGKTTIGHAVLANGFEIVESSSCVDPANYDHGMGAKIVRQRIKDRVWMLLGFTLQWARNGVDGHV